MPEGPEIRRAADKVANAIVGQPPIEVFFAFDHLKPYGEQLKGVPVLDVETHGKAMLTRFDNGLNIYSHNQLYGRWVIRDPYDYPETNRQLRLAIHNQDHSALLYSASDIEVLADDDLAAHPFLSKIGPDLLHESVTVEQVAERFVSDRFRRRKLAHLLLDQHFLAGTGNYLRSEIIHVAGTHPDKRPMDLDEATIQTLAEASVGLTRQSYETGGVTNDLELVKALKAEGKKFRTYRYRVFGRDGKQCYRCGAPIVKTEYGGRRLYLCRGCQG